MDKLLICRERTFYAAYFSYYVMITGVGLALFSGPGAFFHYLSVISFVFYVCYSLLSRRHGPRIFFRELEDYQLPADVQPAVRPSSRGDPGRAVLSTHDVDLSQLRSAGAAFPSSHVAVAIATVFFSFRYLRPIRWPHLAVVSCFAWHDYCRYHYAVDVAAGGLTAACCPRGQPALLQIRFVSGTGIGRQFRNQFLRSRFGFSFNRRKRGTFPLRESVCRSDLICGRRSSAGPFDPCGPHFDRQHIVVSVPALCSGDGIRSPERSCPAPAIAEASHQIRKNSPRAASRKSR